MSFILDALRKSEAARRRSEAPDLFAAMPAATEPPRARAAWPLWLLGTVAAISLIAVLWLLAQRAPPAQEVSEAPLASSTADATAETAPADNIAATTPIAAPTPVPTPPPTPPSMDREPPPAAMTTAKPPPVTPLPPTRDLPPPLPEAAVVAPPPAPPARGGITSLADLDPATRKLLPPLKLSMHLWNETPAQRFVIVDGQRLREGDVLGEIVIERITRDGAVLVWRGSLLKIELR